MALPWCVCGPWRAPPATGESMSWLHPLTRHQLAALAATAVDFGLMVVAVRCLRWTPVAGTVAGASGGALTNFALHRHWTFTDHRGPVTRQWLRYCLVALASLGLNAAGEWWLAMVAGIPYVGARVVVAGAVGLLWNFPMHRYVVFPAGRSW